MVLVKELNAGAAMRTIAVATVACGALLALPGGCGGPSVTSTRIRGPDGKDNWVSIECKDSPTGCLQRAGEACPNGYEIAGAGAGYHNEPNRAANVAEGMNAGMQGRAPQHYSDSVYRAAMLIQCHGEPAPAAQPEPRTCMDSNECDRGDTCHFEADAGFTSTGRCVQRIER